MEIALHAGGQQHLIEVHAPRNDPVRIGERVGLQPRTYRLFAVDAG